MAEHVKFGFVAKHRGIWPVRWLCEVLGVSRSGFHAWLSRSPSARARSDEVLGAQVKASFLGFDRTYGVRWSRFLGQLVKLGSPMKDGPDDGQAEAVFG